MNNITIDQIEIFVSLCLKLKKIEYRYNYNKNTIPKIVKEDLITFFIFQYFIQLQIDNYL